MKPALNRWSLAASLAAMLLLAACDSDGGPAPKLNCEFEMSPASLGLGTLCVDGEAEDTFTVTNTGSAECLLSLDLGGPAPQFFSISHNSLQIPVGGNATVTAAYHPAAEAGAAIGQHYVALVTIRDTEGEQVEEVSLDGQTATSETKPILSLSCPSSVKSCGSSERDPGEPCCRSVNLAGPSTSDHPYYGRTYLTAVELGENQTGRTVTLPLEVTNLGCGTLEVSDLELVVDSTNVCDPASVTINTPLPITVPGSVAANARQKATLELSFTPTEPCYYGASATVVSNDPDIKDDDPITRVYRKFRLMGAGVEGHLASFPATGEFGDVGVGEIKTIKFEVENKGGREVTVESLGLRNDSPSFRVAKAERPACPAGSGVTELPLGSPFVLAATDHQSHCGDDHVTVHVEYSPVDAGTFEEWLEVDYGFGALSVKMLGFSRPDLVTFPESTVMFRGPQGLGCEPLTCGLGDLPNVTCDHVCQTDDDCTPGTPCIGGVCALNGGAGCIDTCSAAERVVRFCNAGHAPLRFDSLEAGGGLVVTDPNDATQEGPKHPMTSKDPNRDGQPMFSIVTNGCADASGNGITLARTTEDETGAVVDMDCCEATIRFLDTRNGAGVGRYNTAALRAYTNDPAWPRDGSTSGYTLDLLGGSDYDADPVAEWEAYGEGGPGSPVLVGGWATLDASASYDPACRSDETECDKFNPITSYSWKLVSESGSGSYDDVEGQTIDLDNPDSICGSVPGGHCVEVVEGSRGRIIRFLTDKDYARSYTFELTVSDGVCDPPHLGTLSKPFESVWP